jgi:hypothetical protein
MAKSTTIKIEGDGTVDTETEEENNLKDLSRDERDEVFRVTDEIRATVGARLMIVRTYPSTPDLAGHVGDMTPGEYSPERVRELFGPGRYRIRIVGPKGFLPGGGPLHIAKVNQVPPGPSNGTGDLAQLIALLQKQDDTRREKSNERIGRITELAIPGILTVIAAFVGKNHSQDLTPIIAALKPAPQPSMLEIATMLKQLQAPAESATSPIETLFRIVEVVKDVTGGSEKEDNVWSVVREALKEGIPALRPMLENLQAQQAARTPSLPPPAPAQRHIPHASAGMASSMASVQSTVQNPRDRAIADSAAQGGNSKPTSGTGEDMLALWGMNNSAVIRANCDKITSWAEQKKRPDLYAEVFLDELPQDLAPYMPPQRAIELLHNPDWWSFVTQFHPPIKSHFVWMDQFRMALIELVQDQSDQLEEFGQQQIEPAQSQTAPAPEAPPQIVDVYTNDLGV